RASRATPDANGSDSPVVLIRSPSPYQSRPTTSATAGSTTSPATDSTPETTAFCRSSRPRGTGIASRYFRLDQDASLATVSPKNSAITTTSRKLADANNAKIAKFAPLEMARSTNADDADREPPWFGAAL